MNWTQLLPVIIGVLFGGAVTYGLTWYRDRHTTRRVNRGLLKATFKALSEDADGAKPQWVTEARIGVSKMFIDAIASDDAMRYENRESAWCLYFIAYRLMELRASNDHDKVRAKAISEIESTLTRMGDAAFIEEHRSFPARHSEGHGDSGPLLSS